MKKFIFTLFFGAFAFVSTQAFHEQPKDRKFQKEAISFDDLPSNIREKVTNRELEVTEIFAIKDKEDNLRWYKVKGTVNGEDRVWTFDNEGNRMTHMRGRKGKMHRKGRIHRKDGHKDGQKRFHKKRK